MIEFIPWGELAGYEYRIEITGYDRGVIFVHGQDRYGDAADTHIILYTVPQIDTSVATTDLDALKVIIASMWAEGKP